MINAGKSFNQVPDLAEGVFDIRFTENDDVEALLAEMRGRIKGELVVEAHEPMLFSGKSPYLDLLFEVTPGSRARGRTRGQRRPLFNRQGHSRRGLGR